MKNLGACSAAIMRNVEIQIFPIAATSINDPEVRRWLDAVGAAGYKWPQPDSGLTGAEAVVGLSAKRCYLSFEVGLNPNVTKVRKDWSEYLENILKSGHGCYDAETEVMTKRGWVFWPNVNSDDLFLTCHENIVSFKPATRLVGYYHTGKMYKIDSDQVDLLVTPDHKLWCCKTTTVLGRKRKNFSLIKAEDLGTVTFVSQKSMPDGAFWHGTQDVNPDLARLLGFAIGDAYVHPNCNRAAFHLRRPRKILFLRQVCHRLGWTIIENDDRFNVVLLDEIFHKIYDENKQKVIPVEVFDGWSAASLGYLLEGLINSDGSIGDSVIYDTTSPTLAGQVQLLALLCGGAATISQCSSYRDRRHSYGTRPMNRLFFNERSLKPEMNRYSPQFDSCGGRSFWVDGWEGDVYCAEVPGNLLYVRRNGKPVWSGNSVLEHATYTFAIEGVSRVFSAELNRHRAGVAISEGSMRYIRFNDIPWWLPTSLRDHPDDSLVIRERKKLTRVVFNDVFTYCQDKYAQLTEIWQLDTDKTLPFHVKKAITSCLRRIIPMGVATGGVWTMNMRAIRHILAMRASAAAEEEIALVFSMIGRYIVEKEPRLMCDFTQTPEGYWVPRYPKI